MRSARKCLRPALVEGGGAGRRAAGSDQPTCLQGLVGLGKRRHSRHAQTSGVGGWALGLQPLGQILGG